jgi:hypothetical protein
MQGATSKREGLFETQSWRMRTRPHSDSTAISDHRVDGRRLVHGRLRQPTLTSPPAPLPVSLQPLLSLTHPPPSSLNLILLTTRLPLQRQTTTPSPRRTTFIDQQPTPAPSSLAAARLNTQHHSTLVEQLSPTLRHCRATLFPRQRAQRPSRSPIAVQVTTTRNPSPFTGLATLLPQHSQHHTRSQCLHHSHGRCLQQPSP